MILKSLHSIGFLVPLLTTIFAVVFSVSIGKRSLSHRLQKFFPVSIARSAPEETRSRTVSPPILERRNQDLPNDNAWWPLWVGSYSMPVFLTAEKAGIFEVLTKGSLSSEEIIQATKLPNRSVRILLGHLTAIGVLRSSGNKFRLSAAYKRESNAPRYWQWLAQYQNDPFTTDSYFKAIIGKAKENWDRLRLQDSELQRIADQSTSFEAVYAADRLGVFEQLPSRENDLIAVLTTKYPSTRAAGIHDLLRRLTDF